MDEIQLMALAICKAKEGVGKGQTPFGACVARKGRAIAVSHNTVWLSNDITAHAEMNAIRAACRKLGSIDLSGCTIYSTCEPCPMCFSAIHWAGIKKIISGAYISDAKMAGFNELTISNGTMKRCGKSDIVIAGGFLREECAGLFEIWKNRKGRRAY